MSGSWQAERGSRRTRQLLCGVEVGEDVGVSVGPMEFKLNWRAHAHCTALLWILRVKKTAAVVSYYF